MRETVSRVLLLVIDGLRPDAITSDRMPNLASLAERSWRPARAVTVRPSATVAALGSLATGVAPETHGLKEGEVPSLQQLRALKPLPLELRRSGIGTTVVTGELPAPTRFLAGGLLRLSGVDRLLASANSPMRIIDSAMHLLRNSNCRECVVAYVNDTDIAGHAWGWMSEPYLTAARSIDRALIALVPLLQDTEALLIVTADHGGGGVLPSDHDHAHPLNEEIPLLVAGTGVAWGHVGTESVTLLDLAPTLLDAFGVRPPELWEGRSFRNAFAVESQWVPITA
jgi:arylsulfatase A-like enzyme